MSTHPTAASSADDKPAGPATGTAAPPASDPFDGRRLDHGLTGNGRVLALIAPDTRVEWLCMPRFDSPSVFGRLLDRTKGGTFGFEPVNGPVSTRMEYLTNTNVLRTRVTAGDGVFDVFDFAPRIPAGLGVEAAVELHRLVVPVEGRPRVRVIFDPRPDYGRITPDYHMHSLGLEVRGAPTRFYLRTNAPSLYLLNGNPIRLDQEYFFAFGGGAMPLVPDAASMHRQMQSTVAGWRAWAKSLTIPPFAARSVLRSALCLKLHANLDTGAVIAATTTSIPEAPDTERTWDYRYCWLRDAAFTIEALRRLGQLNEGEDFIRFLQDVAEGGPLQPVYGIGGERDLVEQHLDHLEGFAGGRPVRIGNAAYIQKQHDLMGELILCLETLVTDERLVIEDPGRLLPLVERLVEEAIAVAPTPDTGIWEFRTLLRHYTFSQAMCWVAAHRGAELALVLKRPDLADRWESWAKKQRALIMEKAYDDNLGYFTQAFGSPHPDAGNLLLPTIGFVDPRDPRFVSTVRAYEKLLVEDGLMLRYRNRDDFGDTHSAFTICSFWWCEALAMIGELDRAVELFRRLEGFANPVGLFSEDIDPKTGRLIGNFPQAYTHVGLIHAATTIGELLEARDARFRAWA